MAETLSHLDADENTGAGSGRGPTPGTSRWHKVVGILGALVVLWVGNDTYTIIDGDFGSGAGGGGEHGPSQDAPAENQDQETDTDDGGGHTPGPPAGGHG